MKHGFNFVCDRFDLKYNGIVIIFTHIPIPTIYLNIHGHLHNIRINNFNDINHYLINLEGDGYRLQNLNEILKKHKRKHKNGSR